MGKDRWYNLDDQAWLQIWTSFPFCSSILSTQWQTIKTIMRWYYTPLKMNKINSNISPKCVKGSGVQANYLHNWWHCSYIKNFWSKILTEVKTIIDSDIPFTIPWILLNYWSSRHLDSTSWEICMMLLTIAKASIALKWRDAKLPSIQVWRKKVLQHFVLNKLEFVVSNNTSSKAYNNFTVIWFPVLQYLNECNFDSDLDVYSSLLFFWNLNRICISD